MKLQLNEAKSKLDHNLPLLYKKLQNLNPSKLTEYAGDYDEFNNSMIMRIIGAQTEISTKKEKPIIADTTSSSDKFLNHLPRLEPLKFSGKVEEYPEFKRNWLSRFGNLDSGIQLQYLKPSLPLKDQPKVSAVDTIEECWTRLGKIYGDKQVNVSTVKSNLRNLRLLGSQRCERSFNSLMK